jgi:hypothetical protein
LLTSLVEKNGSNTLSMIGLLVVGDVAGDLGGANDLARRRSDRRNAERDVDRPAILADADRLVVIDPLPLPQALEEAPHFAAQRLGNDDVDRFADRLVRRVAEQALGARIPAGNDAVQGLGHDRVIG